MEQLREFSQSTFLVFFAPWGSRIVISSGEQGRNHQTRGAATEAEMRTEETRRVFAKPYVPPAEEKI